VALNPNEALKCRAHSDQYESTWLDQEHRQTQCGKVLSSEVRVTASTLSFCESTDRTTPSATRVSACLPVISRDVAVPYTLEFLSSHPQYPKSPFLTPNEGGPP
jgi:hypothetical protein